MANAASRFIMWTDFVDLVGRDVSPTAPGFTDAQLDDFKNNWGIDGFVMAWGRWIGGAGNQNWSGTASDVHPTAVEWQVQRRIRDSNIMGRLRARDMKLYLHINSASQIYASGYRGMFLDIWNDATWTDELLPVFAGIAGACKLYGINGIDWDCEDYPQTVGRGTISATDPILRPSWRWDRSSKGTHTEAETRAQMKKRGADIANAFSGTYPALEVGGNFIRFPMSWNAWVQATSSNTDAGGPQFVDQFTISAQMDWVSGLFSTRQMAVWIQSDRTAYKQYTTSTTGSLRTGMKINHLSMMPYMSQYPGMDWDYAASRWWNCAMVWIDPGDNDQYGTPTQVADQLDQASKYASGQNLHNFERYFPDAGWPGPASGTNYETYKPGMRAASTDRTIDTASPTINVTSSQTVGNTQVISGTSYDDFAIWHVTWKNNRSLLTGEAKLTLVDESGRPMQPRETGTTNPLGAFNTADYTTWKMSWTATVPLQQSNDSITLTAVDIHGLTAAVNVTGGVPITPSTQPTVVANAAANVTQNTASLSGTVNPQGSATTAQFQYGTTTAYGSVTAVASVGSGTVATAFSANLTALSPGVTYHYRLTATNAAGTSVTGDRTFTTTATAALPVVTLNAESGITQNAVTVSGDVDPQGLDSTALFEYGLDTNYGNTTASTSVPASGGVVTVTADLSGLAANTLYHYRLRATNSAGTASTQDDSFTTLAPTDPGGGGDTTGTYAEAVLDLVGLRGYWRMGETTGAILDSAGTNTGTLFGGVTRGATGIPGAPNGSVTFDGTSAWVSIPDDPALDLGDGPLTLMAWIKRSALAIDTVIDKGTGGYQLQMGGSGDNRVKAHKSNFSNIAMSSTAITDTTDWHFIVWTYDGVVSTIYVDGVDRTGSQTNLDLVDTTLPLTIGGESEGSTARFGGSIDEVAITSSVLTAQQVANLYTLGSSPAQQVVILGLITETDTLLPVVQSGGASGGTVGTPAFVVGDDASFLKDVTALRGEGTTSAPPTSEGDPFFMRDTSLASQLRGDAFLRGPGTPAAGTTTISIGQATETDALLPVTLAKTRAVGLLVETGSLFAVQRGGHFITIGLVTETDTLLKPSKGRAVALLTETDEALALVSFDVPARRRPLDEVEDTVVAFNARALRATLPASKRTAVLSPHVLSSD